MKRLTGIFVLSKSEQRVMVIIVLALIAGALVEHQRRAHQLPVHATPATKPEASPSPAEAEDRQ